MSLWKTLNDRPARAGAVLLALLTLGILAASSQVQAGPTKPQGNYGTIKGRLVWGGKDVPKQQPITADKDTQVCGKTPLFERKLVVDPETKGVKWAFAYLVNPKGSNDEKVAEMIKEEPEVEIDQKGCEFLPYATALIEKQTLVFKSSDPIGHNVRYSGFVNPTKNISLQPNGSLESKLVAEKRPMPLKCDIHPWMSGWIMVFDHPFFAVTGDDGSFEITGVPVGKQNLQVWQEMVGYVAPGGSRGMAVDVKAGEVTDVGEITLDPAKVKK